MSTQEISRILTGTLVWKCVGGWEGVEWGTNRRGLTRGAGGAMWAGAQVSSWSHIHFGAAEQLLGA